jgi:hypothetical protein
MVAPAATISGPTRASAACNAVANDDDEPLLVSEEEDVAAAADGDGTAEDDEEESSEMDLRKDDNGASDGDGCANDGDIGGDGIGNGVGRPSVAIDILLLLELDGAVVNDEVGDDATTVANAAALLLDAVRLSLLPNMTVPEMVRDCAVSRSGDPIATLL